MGQFNYRVFILAVVLIGGSLLSAGCGNKGKLYLPDEGGKSQQK